MRRTLTILAILAGGLLPACDQGDSGRRAADRRERYDQQIRRKYGKGLDELPTVQLVVISPHNQNIEEEFAEAFSLRHALQHGEKVEVDYRDVGGGSNQILEYLRNVYGRAETAEIDVVWGGGEQVFMDLAEEGILQPMELPKGYVENTPVVFGGLEMYDTEGLWAGTAVSGFGFIYNRDLLRQLGIEEPTHWEDLGAAEFLDLVALADPMKSGSAATAYEIIVQSADDWPSGWARLLSILGNSKKFYDGASQAADAPVVGEAPVATCIDFYGAERVAEYPDSLVYVSPEGQTAFNPDPIAILKNPPHPGLAQRFIDFVLSLEGQALWAVQAGAEGGPVSNPLSRQPIRKDVYTEFAGRLSPWVVNPYGEGNEMQIDTELKNIRFGVLRHLVRAAAINNARGLRAAKRTLVERGLPEDLVTEFNALPPDLRTREDIIETARKLRDETAAEQMTTGWQEFFRQKYERIAR